MDEVFNELVKLALADVMLDGDEEGWGHETMRRMGIVVNASSSDGCQLTIGNSQLSYRIGSVARDTLPVLTRSVKLLNSHVLVIQRASEAEVKADRDERAAASAEGKLRKEEEAKIKAGTMTAAQVATARKKRADAREAAKKAAAKTNG